MNVTVYDGEFPDKDGDTHKFKCDYVRSKDNSRYVLFDFVNDYKNVGSYADLIIGDGGKISIWLKYYKFTIEERG